MSRLQPSNSASCLVMAIMITTMAAGCVSSPEPEAMARTTLQTAPADLQLLCAGAVAKQSGATADKVLPTSSRQLDAKSFQVELDAAGRKHSCVVDGDGNVTSVTAL
jgi:hypothetical protein